MKRSRSVRHKLASMVLLSTLAGIGVSLVAMVAYDLRVYHQGWISDLSTQADLLGRTSAPALSFDDQRAAQENVELLRARPEIRAAALYNARGVLFAKLSTGQDTDLPALPEADGVKIVGNQIVVFRRVTNGREILGSVYLRADYELWDRLVAYLGIALVVAAAALAVAWALSRQLQRSVTRPLQAISATAREVSEKHNFALRAEKLSEDEFGALAEAFNRMLGEIERTTREFEREAGVRRRAEDQVLKLNAELEKRVRDRTAQLEYANGELEAFCSSVSHDLRAPLRSINGFSEALVEELPADLPEEAKSHLARIRAATERMGQLIDDLLNLARVSRAGLSRRDVDVSDIARQVIRGLKLQDPERAIEVSVWDGMQANADPRLLRAAMENLLGNAWKFTARAEAARIEVGSLRDGDKTTFYVRDNGAGFDMKYADKLFVPFQRLHAARQFAGTGIGLATVQRIMHRHGGRIWADAQPGKGAVFHFTLDGVPADGASAAASAAAMAPEPMAEAASMERTFQPT